MQSLTGNTSTNTNFETSPFQILRTTQTQEIHTTATSFTIKRIRLAALAKSFATRWGEGRMGPGMDSSHQTLMKDCYDALDPAALVAAVTPQGFRGAIGGYGNLQRIATSSSLEHSGYLADRSARRSLASSSSLWGLPADGLHNDENHQLIVAEHCSKGTVERGTDGGDVNNQRNIHGQSNVLTRSPLWKPRDRKKSTLSDRPGSADLASSPPQSKPEIFDSYAPLGASASARSIGTVAIPQSPSTLGVERDCNNKLKRARNSAEDREEKDAECQGVDNRTRKRKRTAASAVSQPPTAISLPVERKKLKCTRDPVEDDEGEDHRPSVRVKLNEGLDVECVPPRVFGFISESRRTRIQAQTQIRMQKQTKKVAARKSLPLLGRARSGPVASRLRRDSFGEIS